MQKRDLFRMTKKQVLAGRRMWHRTGQEGRLAKSSFDAESMAPKTWILYANPKGEEIKTIECELYTVGRVSDASEGIVMLVGMCPRPECGETFMAREDNKTMHIDYVTYRKAPGFLRVNWEWHCKHVLNRPVLDGDRIPVVSSPERWACDYCKAWCVRVYDGVAKDDHSGSTKLVVSEKVASFDLRKRNAGPRRFRGGMDF